MNPARPNLKLVQGSGPTGPLVYIGSNGGYDLDSGITGGRFIAVGNDHPLRYISRKLDYVAEDPQAQYWVYAINPSPDIPPPMQPKKTVWLAFPMVDGLWGILISAPFNPPASPQWFSLDAAATMHDRDDR